MFISMRISKVSKSPKGSPWQRALKFDSKTVITQYVCLNISVKLCRPYNLFLCAPPPLPTDIIWAFLYPELRNDVRNIVNFDHGARWQHRSHFLPWKMCETRNDGYQQRSSSKGALHSCFRYVFLYILRRYCGIHALLGLIWAVWGWSTIFRIYYIFFSK